MQHRLVLHCCISVRFYFEKTLFYLSVWSAVTLTQFHDSCTVPNLLNCFIIAIAKPVRPKQMTVCSPTNPFYTYIRATEQANTYSNALFQNNVTQPSSASVNCNPNSVQSNT